MAFTVWTKWNPTAPWHPSYSDDTHSEAIEQVAQHFRDTGHEVRIEENNWDLKADAKAAEDSEQYLREIGA